jgi:hypothetical protein
MQFKLISFTKRASKEEFIEQAKKTHGLNMITSNIEYLNAKSGLK